MHAFEMQVMHACDMQASLNYPVLLKALFYVSRGWVDLDLGILLGYLAFLCINLLYKSTRTAKPKQGIVTIALFYASTRHVFEFVFIFNSGGNASLQGYERQHCWQRNREI